MTIEKLRKEYELNPSTFTMTFESFLVDRLDKLQSENTKLKIGWDHDKKVLASWKETAQRVTKERQSLQAENAELKRDINVYENALKKIEVDSGIALLGDDQHYNKPLK